jgi:hypothetical protein
MLAEPCPTGIVPLLHCAHVTLWRRLCSAALVKPATCWRSPVERAVRIAFTGVPESPIDYTEQRERRAEQELLVTARERGPARHGRPATDSLTGTTKPT